MRPTHERLRQLLDYDLATGVLTWKPRRYGRGYPLRKSHRAGNIRVDGYRAIFLDGRPHYAHAIIWCWMMGSWPTQEVDHIDLNRDNNSWANLRLVTPSQNSFGRGSKRYTRGVSPLRNGKWRAFIGVNRKKIYLGSFPTMIEALKARRAAEIIHFGEFAPGAIAFRSPQ